MKERPILMTPDNAQKCHEGVKTQTRRTNGLKKVNGSGPWDYPQMQSSGIAIFLDSTQANPYNNALEVTCPYGVVGDRLWVREAWAWPGEEAFLYKGNPSDARLVDGWRDDQNNCQVKWKQSIHMPRLACRTVLEITEIRVERLQDISTADAMAEGVTVKPDAEIAARVAGPPETGARMEYFALWESINGVGSWALNPWVWVLTFQKVGVLTFQKVGVLTFQKVP